ncbi:hemerythrin domain-containing protein [Streptomyces sp. NPDC051041]|uniref:hemerythrin domain-containing protein n=1 Tax=Streptomyces sp. NPDC051041 TaxID=3365640 RepID=UPI0037BE0B3E
MTDSSGPHARLRALSSELISIHQWLRDELARLKREVAAHLDGRGERPTELRAHCAAFCSALTDHHTGEDNGAFPELARSHPDLRPVIDKLMQDHQMVSTLVQSLQRLVTGLPEKPSPKEARRISSELDGLAAILESHFVFEERRITDALDALPPEAGSTEKLLGLSAP